MKRFALVSGLCAFALLFAVSATAETWSTQAGDFTVHFWKEMFKGGGPGQPGNTLMATGQGFMFNQATLESTEPGPGPNQWTTTYVDGRLTLNSQGPWLERKALKASDITAINVSSYDQTTGELEFELTFSGYFDNQPDLYFEVVATYFGVPEMNPDFQRDWEFDVTITLGGE